MRESTTIGIVGGGPAGLMLSHLLQREGIDHIVVEARTREEIENTHRAGILEQGSADMLLDGVSDRVLHDGERHDGIDIRINGESYPVDFRGLVGASTYLYPQTDVFIDLADKAERDERDVRFGLGLVDVDELTDSPIISYLDPERGERIKIRCELLVGADGSRSTCRRSIPERERRAYFREYPFAWFGIMAQTEPSHDELIYARSDAGFALISQRTPQLQRLYFQCDPGTDPNAWTDDDIWATFRARVNFGGFELNEGPIVDKTVLGFRSFVSEPMRWGNLLLAGDAAHTVPPTGAKGLNLALQDVRILAESLAEWHQSRSDAPVAAYSERCLRRVWEAQNFSYWMTSMLHTNPDASDFDQRRALAELRAVVDSEHGKAWLAESYTGWPNERTSKP